MSLFEKEFEDYFKQKNIKFKRNDRSLPGTPDFSFQNGAIVLFLHGCFWHGHNCQEWKLDNIWKSRISVTISKDIEIREQYLEKGIKYIRCWECEFKFNKNLRFQIIDKIISDPLSLL